MNNGCYTEEKMTQPITAKVNNKTMVDKTVSTGKSVLSLLSAPIKTKYTKTKRYPNVDIFCTVAGRTIGHDTRDMRALIIFKAIFGNKYCDIKLVKKGGYLARFPYNGVYFKRLDKYTIVVCTIEDKFDEDDNSTETDIKFNFIGKNAQTISTRLDGLSTKHYQSIMDKLLHKRKKDYVSIYNNFRHYDDMKDIKSFDDLILKDDVKNEIIDTLDTFLNNENVYSKYKIKYKIGFLFWGDSGTGKSSLAYTIALYLGYPLVIISPEFIYNYIVSPNDQRPLSDLGDRTKRVVLIEEIDTMMNNCQVEGSEGSSCILRRDHILKFIDALPSGTVVIANTNHYDKLDKALIRSGRFDTKLEIGLFEMAEALKMIRYYGINESYINNYKLPVCPSTLQFDLVQEVSKKLLNKED